jgi:hypothetical protein
MKKFTATLLSAGALILSVAGPAFAHHDPTYAVTPEPGTFALLGLGAVGLAVYKKMKK